MDILTQFGYTEESIQEEIFEMVGDENKPLFYAVSGSHLYGFPSSESDLDIRGFHLSKKDHNMLDAPDEQIRDGQEGGAGEVDFVSYELRKYGRLLDKGNYNVIELLFNAPTVFKSEDAGVRYLRQGMREYLPMDMAKHYRGMAKHNYYKYLNPRGKSYKPNAKKFLYVLRGLLAARYVSEEGDVEANVIRLSVKHEDADRIVDELIEWKARHGIKPIPNHLAVEAHQIIGEMIHGDEFDTEYDVSGWRNTIDDWMGKVRKQ